MQKYQLFNSNERIGPQEERSSPKSYLTPFSSILVNVSFWVIARSSIMCTASHTSSARDARDREQQRKRANEDHEHEVVRDDLDPRHRVHPTVMRSGEDERRERHVSLGGVQRRDVAHQLESFGITVTQCLVCVREACDARAGVTEEQKK